MKNLIIRILEYFTLKKIKQNAVLNDKIIISRFSKVILINGAKKENVVFGQNTMFKGQILISGDGKITIGDNSSIRSNCIFYCAQEIEIGRNVILSNDIIITDTNHHPIHPIDRIRMIESGWGSNLWSWEHAQSKKIRIEDNVWIGQYSRILKGVNIGENSIVASNSIVTRDVPPNCIVAGNPAKLIRSNIELEPRVF